MSNEPNAALFAAMAGAFPKIGGALKDSNNPHLKSKYADLSSVVDAIRPALIEGGLFFIQMTHDQQGGVCVETIVCHSGGGQMSFGKLFVPASKNDAQGYGSALTYARRYSLMTAFGVCPEDDDGNAASRAPQQQNEAPACISREQMEELRDLVEKTGTDIAAMCRHYKIAALPHLPASKYQSARAALVRRLSIRVTDLYFITDVARTAVKIGLSRHPERRLKDLQAGSPVQLVIDHIVFGVDRSIERDLHQHFAKWWRHREWFDYAPEIAALVEDLKAGGPALFHVPAAPYPKGYRCDLGWLLTDEDTLRDGVMPQLHRSNAIQRYYDGNDPLVRAADQPLYADDRSPSHDPLGSRTWRGRDWRRCRQGAHGRLQERSGICEAAPPDAAPVPAGLSGRSPQLDHSRHLPHWRRRAADDGSVPLHRRNQRAPGRMILPSPPASVGGDIQTGPPSPWPDRQDQFMATLKITNLTNLPFDIEGHFLPAMGQITVNVVDENHADLQAPAGQA